MEGVNRSSCYYLAIRLVVKGHTIVLAKLLDQCNAPRVMKIYPFHR